MDKEEIQNKIKQLERELNELKESLSRSKEPDRWKGYTIGYHRPWNNAKHSYFRTQALGELREKQREAEDELFNIWEHLVGNWRPDWSDNKNLKYCVEYHRGNIKVNANISVSDRSLYRFFPTEELARRQYELASDHTRTYMRGEF